MEDLSQYKARGCLCVDRSWRGTEHNTEINIINDKPCTARATLLGSARLHFSVVLRGWLWLTLSVGWILRLRNSGLSSMMFCSCSGVLTRVLLASRMRSPGRSRPCLSMTESMMILATITFPASSSVTVSPCHAEKVTIIQGLYNIGDDRMGNIWFCLQNIIFAPDISMLSIRDWLDGSGIEVMSVFCCYKFPATQL